MDSVGIARTTLLGSPRFTLTQDPRSGFSGCDENNLEIAAMARSHPDRFDAWPTLDPGDPEHIDKLERSLDLDARGLKLYLGHGYVSPFTGRHLFHVCAMDSEPMMRVYELCVARELPVCLHVNCGRTSLGFLDELRNVLRAMPGLRVNVPHWLLCTANPATMVSLFREFANLRTDVSFGQDDFLRAGLMRISKSVTTFRDMVSEFSGRFMFGTDLVITESSAKSLEWMVTRIRTYLSLISETTFATDLVPGVELQGLGLVGSARNRVLGGNYLELTSRSVGE